MTQTASPLAHQDKPACPLKADHTAAPAPLRAADFGGREGRLTVGSEGLVSDHYSMRPARSVLVDEKAGTTCASLEPGTYTVAKLNTPPVRDHDQAPNMVQLVPTGELVDLEPYKVEGVGWVHVLAGEQVCAVFTRPDGQHVAIDVDKLPTDGAEHASVDVPPFFGRSAVVRWTLQQNISGNIGPTLFTRKAYSTMTKANGGGREVYVSGEWQCVVMPVRLSAAKA